MHTDEVYHSERYERSNDTQDNWQDNQQGMPENKNKEFIFKIQLPKMKNISARDAVGTMVPNKIIS